MWLADHFFYLIREHRLLLSGALTVLWVGLVAYGFIRAHSRRGLSAAMRTGLWLVVGVVSALVPVVVLLGGELGRAYVMRFGERGTGVVVDEDNHNTQVLLTRLDGRTYLTSFNEQTSGVMQTARSWRYEIPYAHAGERFTIRYLPDLPACFVILADDARSAFGQRVRAELACPDEKKAYGEAQKPYRGGQSTPEIKATLLTTLDVLRACPDLSLRRRQQYDSIRQRVAAGQPLE